MHKSVKRALSEVPVGARSPRGEEERCKVTPARGGQMDGAACPASSRVLLRGLTATYFSSAGGSNEPRDEV